MRVLWLVKGLGPGGAERLLVSAAAAHDRREFEFRVTYLLPWKDALVPELEALGVACTCLGVNDERDLRWARRLRRDLRATRSTSSMRSLRIRQGSQGWWPARCLGPGAHG